MNPLVRWRPTIAFLAALGIWSPTANAFIHGNLDVTPTGLRFVIALAASWIGVTVLSIVVGGYGGYGQQAGGHREATGDGPADTLED